MCALLWLLVTSAAGGEPEVTMSLEQAAVHRPARVADCDAFDKLPEAVVVLEDAPADLQGLAKAFAAAVAAKAAVVRSGCSLYALATGPMLDGPDKVQPRRLVRRGAQVELEVVHTAVRLQGARLRRNIRWRPMVQAPLDLPPGRYRLRVTWRALAMLPNGRPLKAPARTASVSFEIQSGK